jgi:hypothetical protein
VGREAESGHEIAEAVLNGGRLRARTPVPVIGNAGSYPARRTKTKRSRQSGRISTCIYAVALRRRGGKKGGPARAAAVTAEERSESARKAVQVRWAEAKLMKSS